MGDFFMSKLRSDSKKQKALMIMCAGILFLSLVIPTLLSISGDSSDFISTATDAVSSTVIIDAGHGGEDCGAIGTNGIYEKDLNLAIATKLGEYLESAGYNVIYTRTDDRLLYTEEENIKGMRKIYDLKNRMRIANEAENATLISVHMNSYGSSSARGLQVYYSENREDSRILAEKIQTEIKSSLQPTNKRTVKGGENIYLLENAACCAILIECGFISNPEECEKLSEKEYQKELCFAILCGIIKYTKYQTEG